MAVDVITAFLAVGGIIAVGFLASIIFERTRIPDIMILILLGVILGPVAASFGIVLVPANRVEMPPPAVSRRAAATFTDVACTPPTSVSARSRKKRLNACARGDTTRLLHIDAQP